LSKQNKFPETIDGLKPLFMVESKEPFAVVQREGKQVEIVYLALVRVEKENCYYVLGCDSNFDSHTNYFFEELEDALEDVVQIYKLEKINWRPMIPGLQKEKTIIFRQWEFIADKKETEKTYSKVDMGGPEACGCNYCKNFAHQRSIIYPQEVKELFLKLGVDIRKEAEVVHYVKNGDGTHNYGGWFHFKGKMLKGKDCKIPLGNGGSTFDLTELTSNFSIGFTHDYALNFFGLKEGLVQIEFSVNLPWVIDKELEQE
jgi:hypothetical protein